MQCLLTISIRRLLCTVISSMLLTKRDQVQYLSLPTLLVIMQKDNSND